MPSRSKALWMRRGPDMTEQALACGSLRVIHIWGTAITVDVRDPVGPEAVDRVCAWFQRVDDIFSTWRADSEVSRLARATS